MTLLELGVIGTSAKDNELRLPLHPEHLSDLDADLRERITLEIGYGERFGVSDADLSGLVAGLASREEILAGSDVVLLPKPQHADVALLREGAVLWGWPHCGSRPHPGRDRPTTHADRLRGHEPLDPGRPRRAARVPQEQRARGLQLGAAGAAAHRQDG